MKGYSFAMLAILLSGCAANSGNKNESIRFSSNLTDSTVLLECAPANEHVAADASWVVDCNSRAFSYLQELQNSGVSFDKDISINPFGEAAQFMAAMLRSKPMNFRAVQITNTWNIYKNVTAQESDCVFDNSEGQQSNAKVFKARKMVPPSYPIEAAKNQVEGYVMLSYDLDEFGRPLNIRVIESEPLNVFSAAAVDALKQWEFQHPDGSTVDLASTCNKIQLDFRLSKEKERVMRSI